MLTTFDRYLIRRYFAVFFILLVSLYGLFVVLDGFTNVDAFQEMTSSNSEMLQLMGKYYLIHASGFFNATGCIMGLLAVVVVFALLKKNSELEPILAAGIPTWRLVRPILLCVLVVNVGVLANSEFIVPEVASTLQAGHGRTVEDSQKVEPTYDFVTRIRLDGAKLFPGERLLQQAEFVLPLPEVSQELITLRAEEAHYHQASGTRPAGWVLHAATPAFESLPLTPAGEQLVQTTETPGDIFVATDVSFDRLVARSSSYQYVSLAELARRIRNPAYGTSTVRGKLMHFHWRLLNPIANLVCVPLIIPILLKRESYSLVMNVAKTVGILGLAFIVCQAFLLVGQLGWLSPALAAWLPIILLGSTSTWCSNWAMS